MRDNIRYEVAVNYSSNLLKSFKPILYTTTKPENPSEKHFPILLMDENINISDSLKNLCAKGPSFVPTPEYFDWLQLQKDFDAFRNRLRARYIFKDNENQVINENESISIKNPPKRKSKWKATRTSSAELETFLKKG